MLLFVFTLQSFPCFGEDIFGAVERSDGHVVQQPIKAVRGFPLQPSFFILVNFKTSASSLHKLPLVCWLRPEVYKGGAYCSLPHLTRGKVALSQSGLLGCMRNCCSSPPKICSDAHRVAVVAVRCSSVNAGSLFECCNNNMHSLKGVYWSKALASDTMLVVLGLGC